MSRIIKFRVWDIGTSHMHIVGTSQHDSLEMEVKTNAVFYYNLQNGCGSLGDDSEYVLMQFTGLLDKNERDIYEDDIVKLPMVDNKKGDIATFEFIAPNYFLKGVKGNYEIGSPTKPIYYEVVGNIWENPELIDEEENHDNDDEYMGCGWI